MSTIIFDFDHTLLDTSKITGQISNIFLKNGVPEKTIEAIQKTQRARDNDNVDFLEQIKSAEQLGYKINTKDIEEFFSQNLERCLKGPVKEVLEKLSKQGHKLFLFTKGVEYFQMFKIRQSGIGKYFKGNIFVFDNNRTSPGFNIYNNGKTFFVSNDSEEIKNLEKTSPKIKFINIKKSLVTQSKHSKNKLI